MNHVLIKIKFLEVKSGRILYALGLSSNNFRQNKQNYRVNKNQNLPEKGTSDQDFHFTIDSSLSKKNLSEIQNKQKFQISKWISNSKIAEVVINSENIFMIFMIDILMVDSWRDCPEAF